MMEQNHEGVPAEVELTHQLPISEGNGRDYTPRNNPFATPLGSAPNTFPGSRFGSSTALQTNLGPSTYFKSRRIKKGEQERPWLDKKDPREKWVWIIPTIGIAIGFGLMAVQVWLGLQRISKHNYCAVLDESWATGLDEDVWTREAEVGGFG